MLEKYADISPSISSKVNPFFIMLIFDAVALQKNRIAFI
jgi:hypothetical protein